MNTQTLHSFQSFYERPNALPTVYRPEQRPFFEALRHIEHGRLSIITPENDKMDFTGFKHGPTAQLRLFDWGVLDELMAYGESGFAEAYMDNRWDSSNLPALLTVALMNAPALEAFFYGKPLYAMWMKIRSWFAVNTVQAARNNAVAHYDLGNDFYSLWLDAGMTYSCGLFEGDDSRSLEDAQEAKYRRILRKLDAKAGDHILEIGCGWGGFVELAARDGIRVTGITLSERQADYTRDRLKRAGLDSLVNIETKDYREVKGQFDHIVSVGMFEHVGDRHWVTYFDALRKHLKPGGRAMVQTTTIDDQVFEDTYGQTGFIEQYIFPGGMLPSQSRFRAALTKAGLECRETYSFGQDYIYTLRHWLGRFEAHRRQAQALGYDERFVRMWRFYLASCIASFASKRTDVIQAELVVSSR